VDINGRILDLRVKELNINIGRDGSAVQDPKEIYTATRDVIKEAVKRHSGDIYAIVLSAQMHGVTVIDRHGRELIPLVTYLDTRPSSILESTLKDIEPYKLYKETGCPPLVIYPLTKIIWLRENYENVFKNAKLFLSAKDYTIFKLLGEAVIDRGVASGSQLLDINKLKWSDYALELCQIGEEKLPELVDCKEELPISRSVALELGLKEPVPLIIGSSDGALHSVGVGAIDGRTLALNLGTSGAIRSSSREVVTDYSKEMRFFCYYIGFGYRLPGGAINNAGIVVKWFKDNIINVEADVFKKMKMNIYEGIDRLAGSVNAGADGLIALPFFTGERFPIRDSKIRGVFWGLKLTHGKAHILRALMEGCAYTLRWIYKAMEENNIVGCKIRIGGGGAKSRTWREIMANVFQLPIEAIHTEEASLLGAAIMGFTALGLYRDLEEACKSMIKVVDIMQPDPDKSALYNSYFERFIKIYRAVRGIQ